VINNKAKADDSKESLGQPQDFSQSRW